MFSFLNGILAKFEFKLLLMSQIYKLYDIVSNLGEICYFIGLYCLNMNVVHYLNMEVVCMIFMCKQHE
jgi:hypothetical protein